MNAGFKNLYEVTCIREGKVIWTEKIYNLVTQEGLDHLLSNYFNGVDYNAVHYLGLKEGSAMVDTSTLLDFVSSYEVTEYTGNRPVINLDVPEAGGEALSRAVSNVADPCLFPITGSMTVTGVGVCTVDSGSAGVLFATAEFSAPRPLIVDDLLSVTCTFTQKSF